MAAETDAAPLPPERKPAIRLQSIDALRGMAALAVVCTHIPRDNQGLLNGRFFAFLPLDFGALGVPLFIVISGFCIHLGVARRAAVGAPPTIDWAQFWKRRFFRLYPPYVAAIAYSLLAYAILNRAGVLTPGEQLKSPVTDIVVHLLMVHNLTHAFDGGLFNPPFWSLGLEEQLYALFALLLVLRRRGPLLRALWISLAVMLVWRFATVWVQFAVVRATGIPRELHAVPLGVLPALGAWRDWPFGWWFLWVLGAVAAEAHTGALKLPSWCYQRRVAIAAVLFCIPTYAKTLGRFTEYKLSDAGAQGWIRAILDSAVQLSEPAFAVAGFVILNRWCRSDQAGQFKGWLSSLLARCGVMSYSLYLTHLPTIALLGAFLPLGPKTSFPGMIVRMLVYIPICLATSTLFFNMIERHFLGTARRAK